MVEAARQLARALKFGHSRIEFESFPFHLAGPVVLRWQLRRGIRHVNKGTFTLRCVEEWLESRRAPGESERREVETRPLFIKKFGARHGR